jgi:DNA ligase-1
MALTPGDLLQTVYLCVNKLAPEYEGTKLGVGESIIMKAIGEATGRTMAALKADYDQQGDLGLVANVKIRLY